MRRCSLKCESEKPQHFIRVWLLIIAAHSHLLTTTPDSVPGSVSGCSNTAGLFFFPAWFTCGESCQQVQANPSRN